jgi:hypothetical protein
MPIPMPTPPRSRPETLTHSHCRLETVSHRSEISTSGSSNSIPTASSLAAPTPHVLQQSIPLTQPIQRIITLAHRAHEAAQRIDLVLARVASVFVHLADGDLHRGVVFGFDDAVGGAAFAGDVAVLKIN